MERCRDRSPGMWRLWESPEPAIGTATSVAGLSPRVRQARHGGLASSAILVVPQVNSNATTGHTLQGVLRARAHATPDKVCYYIGGASVTFAELERRTNLAAHTLVALGVGQRDCVALFADSCLEWLYVWFALPRVGALSVPVNTMFKGDFLAHQLRDANAKLAVVSAQLLDRLLELESELPELTTVVVIDLEPAQPSTTSRLSILPAGVLTEGDPDEITTATQLDWHEPATLMYTSGTTGPSKGVMISQHCMITAAEAVVDAGQWDVSDVLYGALPLFHGSGILGLVLPPLITGGTGVIDKQFSVSGCWDQVRHFGATGMIAVGTMIMMLLSLPETESDKSLPLKTILAVPIPAELHHQIEQRYGVRLTTMYGLTEAQPITVHGASETAVPGSAGRASRNFEVRVVDEFDRKVRTGDVGEIVCRPRYPHVMFEGYRGRPQDTLRQIRNLWFHTGDFGRLDANGTLFFVDRKKDAIRRRGENISSAELEQIVVHHPGVAECAAIAVPSDVGEDDVKICVVRTDTDLTHWQLMEHCVAHIPYFALPRYIEFVSELPRNATGRVQKFLLREDPFGPSTWDRDAEGYVVRR